MPYGFEDMLEDLDIPESLSFLTDQSQNGVSTEEDPYALPKDGSLDWESLPNGTTMEASGRDDRTPALETGDLNYDVEDVGASPGSNSLFSTIANGASKVGGYLNENPNLARTLFTGLAGSLLNKGGASAEQLAYAKERQDALNKSVSAYGKTYRKA